MNQYYRQENIRFQCDSSQASHFGGHFERLIRSIKRMFQTVIESHSISDEGVLTFLCEAEDQLNSRPLTPPKKGDAKTDKLITPNDIIRL